ncbi:MAG: glycine cleavage system protein GcvH [Planctomycetota bacterium]|jgi:glycine cleavage system H protein
MPRFYLPSHEWALIEDDVVTIGLSAFAAGEVGEVVHVELPEVGSTATRGLALAEIESVKSVNDFYAPVDGEVVAVNEALEDAPELVNSDAEGEGWFVKIKASNTAPCDGLLDEAAYADHIRS